MVLLGFFWFVFCLQASDSALVYTAALVAGSLWGSVFLHIGVSFPSGRLTPCAATGRWSVAGYLVFPLAFLPALLFTVSDPPPDNLLLVRDDPSLADTLSVLGALAYLGLFAVVARPRRAPLAGRHAVRAGPAHARLRLRAAPPSCS